MRVQGSSIPAPVYVETYPAKTGMARVWLRENIQQLEDKLYEYDEYTTIVPEKANLAAEVEANLPDWLETLRSLEVDDRASLVVDMKIELQEVETKNATLTAENATLFVALDELDAEYQKGVDSL